MSFTIVTDTSANILTPLAKEENIQVIPLSYYIGGEERTCLDTETFDSKAYYDLLKTSKKVTTSQINPQKYKDYMEPILKKGEDVLFIGMSSGISGTFASSLVARDELAAEYPQRKIIAVDSLGASMGEGLIVMEALKCKKEGKSLEETVEHLNRRIKCLYQYFTVDDLMYLRRGGRLSNAMALVGAILQIKPTLKGNENGKIVTVGKVRGRRTVIKALADKLAKLAVNPQNSPVAISHCNCPEDAAILANLIRENSGVTDITIVNHEPVTGSYLGPGALALYFFGDEDVRLK